MANVLIVDDDKLICDTIANLVRRMGHQAHVLILFRMGLKRHLQN